MANIPLYEIIEGKHGKIEDYLTTEKIVEMGFGDYEVIQLIKTTGDIEKYLTPEIIIASKMYGGYLVELMKLVPNKDEIFTTEELLKIIKELKYSGSTAKDIIASTENIEKYLTPEIIKEAKLSYNNMQVLIKENPNIANRITPEMMLVAVQSPFNSDDDNKNLIISTGNIGKYLTTEIIIASKIKGFQLVNLLKMTPNITEVFTPDALLEIIKSSSYDANDVENILIVTGEAYKYLTPEIIKEAQIRPYTIKKLIKEDSNVAKNITPEMMLEIINNDRYKSDSMELIIETGDVSKYLTPEIIKAISMRGRDLASLIKLISNKEEILKTEELLNIIKELKYGGYDVNEIIEATGNIDKYLTPEIILASKMSSDYLKKLIKLSSNITEILTAEDLLNIIKELKYGGYDVNEIIEATGNVGTYLTPEIMVEAKMSASQINRLIKEDYGIAKNITYEDMLKIIEIPNSYPWEIPNLIAATGNIDKFLTLEIIKKSQMNCWSLENLVKLTRNITEVLTPEDLLEIIKELKYNSSDVVNLIAETKNISQYLTLEIMREAKIMLYQINDLIKKDSNIAKKLTYEIVLELAKEISDSGYVTLCEIISSTENVGKYLTKEMVITSHMSNIYLEQLIKLTSNITEVLTAEDLLEIIKELKYDKSSAKRLIIATKSAEAYLTSEMREELKLEKTELVDILKQGGNIEKYLTKTKIKEFGLQGSDVAQIFGIKDERFIELVDEELKDDSTKEEKIMRMGLIVKELNNSNSARLSRVAIEIALEIYELPKEKQQEIIEKIKKIYLTDNLPNVAKDFFVFEQLHPNLINGESDILYGDRSSGNIPSLKDMTPKERKCTIFSDLLRSAMESNNRDLRDYIAIIEQGDKYFNMLKNGELKIDDNISPSIKKSLEKYSDILNSLYNQTSNVKRTEKQRVNTGNLEQDLLELESLLQSNSRIHLNLPDRIVRTFGYWAGIRNFDEVKQIMIDAPQKADDRNRKNANQGKIELREGDFVKGVSDTRYFPSMLQCGVLAKEYLGKNASSDGTPLDMDVERVGSEGTTFKDKYNSLKIAPVFTNGDVSGKRLGKIMLVFENDESFVQTEEGYKVNEEAIESLRKDKSKKEVVDNGGNAYGIRTGLGSTNIKCIIADRYVDKLGLEIAMNGFYIPIVNDFGEVIFTPDMYDKIREKMQGMSYYGIDEFKLDETAKNIGTNKIREVIEESKDDAKQKREMILKTLKNAIEENGMTMLTEREKDLLEGSVEIIDTGSTGRGTNNPGDGDFDFMVRLDSSILNDAEPLKEKLKEALSTLGKPEQMDVTGKGDFRYKGVKIDGLDKTVDLDLTFVRRTDEIEYTTEECIKDRLMTIKNNNPEDYEYVVANILLAKRVLKEAGAYKKKSSPAPEEGQKDTRGGFGAVGIENWILQNGGSFTKAANSFLEVARECKNLSEFQEKYAVWDFGENYMAGEYYSHDNFVYNMTEDGYEKMKNALEEYTKAVSIEQPEETKKKSILELVLDDPSALSDTLYYKSVEKILDQHKNLSRKKSQTNDIESL